MNQQQRMKKAIDLLKDPNGRGRPLAELMSWVFDDPLCYCGHSYSMHREGYGCLWGDNRERCACRMFDQRHFDLGIDG